jgi:hypothetical protein
LPPVPIAFAHRSSDSSLCTAQNGGYAHSFSVKTHTPTLIIPRYLFIKVLQIEPKSMVALSLFTLRQTKRKTRKKLYV